MNFLISLIDIYDVIGLFYHIFMSDPSTILIEEMTQSIYLLLKKTKKNKIEKFKKLRKYILFILKSCTDCQILYLTILCLYEYVLNIPEDGNLAKTGMLNVLGSLSLSMNNDKNVIKIIKIMAYSVEKI